MTLALGIESVAEFETHEHATKPGDICLLCSDGLCEMVEDDDIGMALSMFGANLELAARQLAHMANDNGGRDNVSVILARVVKEYPAARGLKTNVFGWLR